MEFRLSYIELEAVAWLPLSQALWSAAKTSVSFRERERVLYKARIPRDLQEINRRLTFSPPGQLLDSDVSDFSHCFALVTFFCFSPFPLPVSLPPSLSAALRVLMAPFKVKG